MTSRFVDELQVSIAKLGAKVPRRQAPRLQAELGDAHLEFVNNLEVNAYVPRARYAGLRRVLTNPVLQARLVHVRFADVPIAS